MTWIFKIAAIFVSLHCALALNALEQHVYFGFHNRGEMHPAGGGDWAVVTTDGITNPLGNSTEPLENTPTREVTIGSQETARWILDGPAMFVSIESYFNLRGELKVELLDVNNSLLATLTAGAGDQVYFPNSQFDYVHSIIGYGAVAALHDRGNAGGHIVLYCEVVEGYLETDKTVFRDGDMDQKVRLKTVPASYQYDVELTEVQYETVPTGVSVQNPDGKGLEFEPVSGSHTEFNMTKVRYYFNGSNCIKDTRFVEYNLVGLWKFYDFSESAGVFTSNKLINVNLVGNGSYTGHVSMQASGGFNRANIVLTPHPTQPQLVKASVTPLLSGFTRTFTDGSVFVSVPSQSQYHLPLTREEEKHRQQHLDINGTKQALTFLEENVRSNFEVPLVVTVPLGFPMNLIVADLEVLVQPALDQARETEAQRSLSALDAANGGVVGCMLEEEAKAYVETTIAAPGTYKPWHMECTYPNCTSCTACN